MLHPAPGIDARSEDVSERVAVRRRRDARDIGERTQAGIAPVPQDLQPFGDERAVHALERHHVAHGSERHEVEQAEKVGLDTIRVVAVAAECTRGGDQEQKDDTGRSQMPLAGEIVLPVGIEDGEGRRKQLVGLVMVDNDHLRAARVGSLDGRAGRGAAIDGDDEGRTLLGKRGERGRRRPVAFGEAVGDVGRRRLPVGAQEALDQRHGRRAINIVVAEDGDRLGSADGAGEALRAPLHVLKACGVRQEVPERGVEVMRQCRSVGATRGEEAPDQLG